MTRCKYLKAPSQTAWDIRRGPIPKVQEVERRRRVEYGWEDENGNSLLSDETDEENGWPT